MNFVRSPNETNFIDVEHYPVSLACSLGYPSYGSHFDQKRRFNSVSDRSFRQKSSGLLQYRARRETRDSRAVTSIQDRQFRGFSIPYMVFVCRGRKLCQNETTEESRNRESSDPLLTSQLCYPQSQLLRGIVYRVKFDAFIRLKQGEEKLTGKFFFFDAYARIT